jgi:hypothetical protein
MSTYTSAAAAIAPSTAGDVRGDPSTVKVVSALTMGRMPSGP